MSTRTFVGLLTCNATSSSPNRSQATKGMLQGRSLFILTAYRKHSIHLVAIGEYGRLVETIWHVFVSFGYLVLLVYFDWFQGTKWTCYWVNFITSESLLGCESSYEKIWWPCVSNKGVTRVFVWLVSRRANKTKKKKYKGWCWALKPVGLLGFVWSSKKEKKEKIKSPFS